MTPKEKAEELFNRFYIKAREGNVNYNVKEDAKQCALIAVEEIINIPSIQVAYAQGFSKKNKSTEAYWREVKQEIEKL